MTKRMIVSRRDMHKALFDKFRYGIWAGDTFVIEGKGRKANKGYRVFVKADDVTKPTDFDCYDNAQVAAWHRGDWYYAGILVERVVYSPEHSRWLTLPGCLDHSLWGLECGLIDPVDSDYTLADQAKYYADTACELAAEVG